MDDEEVVSLQPDAGRQGTIFCIDCGSYMFEENPKDEKKRTYFEIALKTVRDQMNWICLAADLREMIGILFFNTGKTNKNAKALDNIFVFRNILDYDEKGFMKALDADSVKQLDELIKNEKNREKFLKDTLGGSGTCDYMEVIWLVRSTFQHEIKLQKQICSVFTRGQFLTDYDTVKLPMEFLKKSYLMGPLQYLYPNEDWVNGSGLMYKILWKKCLEKNVFIEARMTLKKHTSPKIVALIPQEGKSELKYEGFHMVQIPYSEYKRNLKEKTEENWNEVVDEKLINYAEDFISKLTGKYEPTNFTNPVLQKHYWVLEGLATGNDEFDGKEHEFDLIKSNFDDITTDNSLIIFDKSKLKNLLHQDDSGVEYGFHRYEISQTQRTSKISPHDQKKKAMFDPESNKIRKNEARDSEVNRENGRSPPEVANYDRSPSEVNKENRSFPEVNKEDVKNHSSFVQDDGKSPSEVVNDDINTSEVNKENRSFPEVNKEDVKNHSPFVQDDGRSPPEVVNYDKSPSEVNKEDVENHPTFFQDDVRNPPETTYETRNAPESIKNDKNYSEVQKPTRGSIMDNFDPNYRKLNETLFKKNESEPEDKKHPYPPFPTPPADLSYDLSEDLPPITVAFRQEADSVPDSTESYSVTSIFKDERTTQKTTLENSPDFEKEQEYDSGGLSEDEEIDYSEYGQNRITYSEEKTPFTVTKSLMNSMIGSPSTTQSSLQDSEVTIHPTLFQPTESSREYEDYEMVTSDYVSHMDTSERENMFSREFLKPWERKRGERITTEGIKPARPAMEILQTKVTRVKDPKVDPVDENSSEFKVNDFMTNSQKSMKNTFLQTTTPYYTERMIPAASSIYVGQPPPLSSFVLVPSGEKYYGDQAPRVVSNTVFNGGKLDFRTTTGKQKIDRENTVEIQNSDYKNQPQFHLYAYKTATHKAYGMSAGKPTVQKFGHWLANPATIFDIPLPIILKTAFVVNSKVLNEKAKAFSDNSGAKKEKFKLDSTKNQLKYEKIKNENSESPDVVSGGSLDSEDFQIESYLDEEELNRANRDYCGFSDLRKISKKIENSEVLNQCFVMAENCLLVDAAPIERRINKNLTECVQFCSVFPDCKSVSYSSVMNICDIFNLKNGTSKSKLLRYDGYIYFQPTRKNISRCLQEKRLHGSPTIAFEDPVNIVPSNPTSIISNEVTPPTTTLIETLTTSRVNPTTKTNPCPPNGDVLVIRADGFRLRNFGIGGIHQNCSESECIFSCLIDIANGIMPYNCTSANYNIRTSECYLYPAGGNIRGNGHLIENGDFAHYEKACADADLVAQCRGYPVDRIPQKVLLGFAILARTANSLLECVTYCYQRYKESSDCLSVSYYYSETMQNCVLNSESHLTASPYFLDEIEVITDYASIDRCLDVREDFLQESDSQETTRDVDHPAPHPGPLAIDNEDGSRILSSNPGFNQDSNSLPEVDVLSHLQEAELKQQIIISNEEDSENEIRRAPVKKIEGPYLDPLPLTSELIPDDSTRNRLRTQLHRSIKKLKP